MLYSSAVAEKSNIEYIVDVYEDNFCEELLEDFLNNRVNKRSILKSVLVDKNPNDTEGSSRESTSNSIGYSKSLKSKKIYLLKK